MIYRFIALLSLFLFSVSQCKDIPKSEEPLDKAIPLPAKSEPKPHKKPEDRGHWNNNWNHNWPSDSSNDWSNNNWDREPSNQKLPQNWGSEHSGEKPCCGKNKWGLPNVPDHSNGWNDEMKPGGLPSSHSEPEPEHEPSWLPPDNNIDANQEEQDWAAPQWKPTPEKKPVCDCERKSPNTYEPSPAFNYPDSPSGIRNSKKNGWGNWQGNDWNNFDKNMKNPKATNKDVNKNEPKGSESETAKSVDSLAIRVLRKRSLN